MNQFVLNRFVDEGRVPLGVEQLLLGVVLPDLFRGALEHHVDHKHIVVCIIAMVKKLNSDILNSLLTIYSFDKLPMWLD